MQSLFDRSPNGIVLIVRSPLGGLHPATKMFLNVCVQCRKVIERHALTTPTLLIACVTIAKGCWKGDLARHRTITEVIAVVRRE